MFQLMMFEGYLPKRFAWVAYVLPALFVLLMESVWAPGFAKLAIFLGYLFPLILTIYLLAGGSIPHPTQRAKEAFEVVIVTAILLTVGLYVPFWAQLVIVGIVYGSCFRMIGYSETF